MQNNMWNKPSFTAGFIPVCSKEMNLANHKFPFSLLLKKKTKKKDGKQTGLANAYNVEPSRKQYRSSSDGPVSLHANSKAIHLGSKIGPKQPPKIPLSLNSSKVVLQDLLFSSFRTKADKEHRAKGSWGFGEMLVHIQACLGTGA